MWLAATARDSGVLGHRKDLALTLGEPQEDSQQRRVVG